MDSPSLNGMLQFLPNVNLPISSSRMIPLASYHDLRDPQGGLGIGDWNTLTILSTGSNPESKIIAHHIDLFQDLGPIANENRSPDRFCTLPFSIKYPSLTSKTKSPLTVLTCPPPIFFTNNPFSTERIISSGFIFPGTISVLLILGIGLCW